MSLVRFLAAHRAEFAALFLQHVLRIGAPVVWIANVVQTIPSLAMFGFLLPLPFIGGLGARVAIVVLILYALLPVLRTTIAGIRGVDAALVEAGTALGM